MQQSNSEIADLFAGADVGLALFDAKLSLLACNDLYKTLCGYLNSDISTGVQLQQLMRVTFRGLSMPSVSSFSFLGGAIFLSWTPSEVFVVSSFGGMNSMPSGSVRPMHLMGIRRGVHDGTKSSTEFSETVCVSITGNRPSAGLNPV